MNIKINKNISLSIFICVLTCSCSKFLSEKPDATLVVPSTITDLDALLDNSTIMNQAMICNGEVASDNYYLSDVTWLSQTTGYQNNYIWNGEIVYNAYPNAWSKIYGIVYTCNVVLESLDKIQRTNENLEGWNNAKGMALFHRAFAFFRATLNWSLVYDSLKAGNTYGIPLRLTPDFNEKSTRAKLNDCYDQIIGDCKSSIPLLPNLPSSVLRPSKCSAYALLARIYLYVGDYASSVLYADSSLTLLNDLIDYNAIETNQTYAFNMFNKEVFFEAEGTAPPLSISNAKIDSNLYKSYSEYDLRKKLYFRKNADSTSYCFKGSYSNSTLFIGLATDEMYLTRAESMAQLGNVSGAIEDVNTLLNKRWKNGTYIPLNTASKSEILNIIEVERRKELIFRDIRWMDLKRYNRDGYNIVVTRKVNKQTYKLAPNSPHYALPIPQNVIDQTGMAQNQ